MVWSVDLVLWGLHTKAGPTDNPESESSEGDFYGVVSYTHAGGIARPLVIHKRGEPAILPHENWRGQFALGTYANGQVSDCPESSSLNCHKLAWPDYRTTAWHLEAEAPDVVTWYGGLVDGMRDASGQMFMRNRYYDPTTGQFTQPDPIGLAGGLNSYGFAAGDPVSYSDPYGLKAAGDTTFTGAEDGDVARRAWQALRSDAQQAVASGDPDKAFGGMFVLGMMNEVESSTTLFEINAAEKDATWRAFFQGAEMCDSDLTRCTIEVDPYQPTDQALGLRLSHELGGALGRFRGILHVSEFGSLLGENAARGMYGCRPFTPSHGTARGAYQ